MAASLASVSVVKGLLLDAGDLVLLQSSTWPEWIGTHLVATPKDEPVPSQAKMVSLPGQGVEVKVDGKRVQLDG